MERGGESTSPPNNADDAEERARKLGLHLLGEFGGSISSNTIGSAFLIRARVVIRNIRDRFF